MADDAEQFVLSQLAHYEREEGKAREQAVLYLKQAEEFQSKAVAYRLVLDDMRKANGTAPAAPVKAPSAPALSRLNNSPVALARFQGLILDPDASSLQRALRSAVEPVGDTFIPDHVRESLKVVAPGVLEAVKDRNAVNKGLSRMAQAGEIFLVRKGRGKTPPVYSKTRPENVEDVASDEDTTDALGGGE